jgi:hypothetical protein
MATPLHHIVTISYCADSFTAQRRLASEGKTMVNGQKELGSSALAQGI